MAFIIADLVKETTTTVGTGALTLDGAVVGHRAFSAKCSIGDTFLYVLRAVDAGGSPTGEWECGLGTYSGVNTITRTTVSASSNADVVVNLSAGTKHVYISMTATQASWIRERLTAARTYYVRADGSDSSTGLANTAAGAFLTIQKAADEICNKLDMGAQQVTVQLADATYTAGVTLGKYIGSVAPIIKGNTVTPANVVLSTTSASAITNTQAAVWAVRDLKVQTTTSGYGLAATGASTIQYENIVFGACASGHIFSTGWSNATATSDYSITAGAPFHVVITDGGLVSIGGRTITITGTPAFSTAFAYLRTLGILACSSAVYSGAATGSRYNISLNSVIFSNGGTLPGDAAGTTATGGQYA